MPSFRPLLSLSPSRFIWRFLLFFLLRSFVMSMCNMYAMYVCVVRSIRITLNDLLFLAYYVSLMGEHLSWRFSAHSSMRRGDKHFRRWCNYWVIQSCVQTGYFFTTKKKEYRNKWYDLTSLFVCCYSFKDKLCSNKSSFF